MTAINGAVVIDKPSGMTSYQVVEAVKRISGARKAGHTGTLDPLATGVLPVCVNEATKLVRFLANDDKEYQGTLLLGVRTDTFDTEGKVLSSNAPLASRQQVEAVFGSFSGRLKQTAPLYSAVKVKGKALYKWARRGIAVAPPEREIEIYAIRMDGFSLPEVRFSLSCSKGTYVRSLCADIGDALGCGGCMSALRRTRSGIFALDRAVTLEGLAQWVQEGTLAEKMIPLAELLPGLPLIEVDDALAGKIRNGYQPAEEIFFDDQNPFLVEGDVIKIMQDKRRLVAVAQMARSSEALGRTAGGNHALKILRVFND
jgi:tRNA pseudouridine55 synthase